MAQVNLSDPDVALSDDDLCDSLGWDVLLRLSTVNWSAQLKRRAAKGKELLGQIENLGLTKSRH